MSKKGNRPQRLKARLPRGFSDRMASDIRATQAMLDRIRAVYELYGFEPLETPVIEYSDALGKFLPDAERPNEGVFSLVDDDEQWLSLRYDLTAPLARHVAQNINEIQLPYRTYRAGWVFRNEKPGPGRFRQFMQFDADTVGAPGVLADAEMCMMMADTMEALGIARGDYVVRVNNRRVLDGVMEAAGITDENQKLAVLRAIDKLDKFGLEGVKLLLGEGRKDESGDFTKGAGLNKNSLELIASYIANNNHALPPTGYWGSPTADLALQEIRNLLDLTSRAGYNSSRVRYDPSVVRGLEYYTGMVYECELTFPVTNEKGETVVFGSVAGGGRYDGLVRRFTGNDIPATGFSIGVSRLMTALRNLGRLEGGEAQAPVLVTVMDGDLDSLARYQNFARLLREAGIRAEIYQGNWKKFGNQLKYADRRGCPLAIIQGSQERERGKVQIKDLIEGRRQAAAIQSHEEWKAERPGQIEVDESDLVEQVRRLLHDHTEAGSR